ncbi:MAG: asparaginase [Proteobacteria bacterium]|nr:asparaginase [Pseudomonadota bacterium]
MSDANPVLVTVSRGDAVESVHRGAVAVWHVRAGVVAELGDTERAVYPRSAAKPLQALPLLESGAADACASDAEIALACASHSGGVVHVAAVGAWLARLGLADGDLACGPQFPRDPEEAQRLVRAGKTARRAHNNCSGKHTGFLATALHLGEPIAGYEQPDHPVQRRIAAVLQDMTGESLSHAPRGIDGCGIPVIGVSLKGLARAMARMAAPDRLAPPRAAAIRRIVRAMAAHPHLVGGEARFDTAAIQAGAGAFVTKTGAEGVHVAIIPRRGLGIALKIDDGAGRAAEVAMVEALRRSGALDEAAEAALVPFAPAAVRSWMEDVAGHIRATDWPGFAALAPL